MDDLLSGMSGRYLVKFRDLSVPDAGSSSIRQPDHEIAIRAPSTTETETHASWSPSGGDTFHAIEPACRQTIAEMYPSPVAGSSIWPPSGKAMSSGTLSMMPHVAELTAA
jgi:hypothetical protein